MDSGTPQLIVSSHQDSDDCIDDLDISVPRRGSDSDRSSASSTSTTSSHYKEFLKLASDRNPSMLLELDMCGKVHYLSKIWQTIVGTKQSLILGKYISEIIVGNEHDKQVFNRAIDMMIRDDNSYRIRFLVETDDVEMSDLDNSSDDDVGRVNVSSPSSSDANQETQQNMHGEGKFLSTNGGVIELEAQGILIHDITTNLPTHSMWIVKPYCEVDELDNLPPDFVERLGFGATIFSQYLKELEEHVILDEQDLPLPKHELCRVCETLVPAWWLETHSEMCICEHRIESTVQLLHDNLLEHKRLIEKITSSIELNDGRITEYKGLPLPRIKDVSRVVSPPLSPSPTGSSPSAIPASSPFKVPTRSRKNSNSIFQSLRFPFKSLAMLDELCEDAININNSELKDNESSVQYGAYYNNQDNADIYEFSPRTRKNIEIVSHWNPNFEVSDPAINLLTQDTTNYAKQKVEAVLRLDNAMKYSLKIKTEVDNYVLQLIKERIESNRINISHTLDYAGQLLESSSSSTIISQHDSNSTSKIASPLPQRVPSRIFADSYIGTDSIPDPSSLKPTNQLSKEVILSGDSSGSNSRPFSRSITPKQSIAEPTNTSELANEASPAEDKINVNVNTPKASSLNVPNLPKLNTSISLTPRKGSPVSSVGFNTPLSSLQKNSTMKSIYANTDRSPVSSPFAVATDYLTPEGHSSNTPIPKQPLSPLLLATNQSKAPTPSINDYNIIKPISKGAYGSVYLARKKLTGEYFAIKVLKKSDMIAKNQVTNVKSERAIMMVQSNKSYVAKLYATFQNKENLFLVMEYLSGGDLAALIKMMGNLPDKWAKQYISEVIVGVDDMHQNGIIHHDLKPDNLLIDTQGHVKLTDFGLSRMGLIRRHKSSRSKKNSISSRKNSLNSEDLISSSSTRKGSINGSPVNTSFIDGLVRKTERSSSASSSQSNFEAPLLKRSGSQVSFSMIDVSRSGTPPPSALHKRTSSVFSSESTVDVLSTPDLALFNPDDPKQGKRFFGTPDYLAPETIEGTGETDSSDWWSVGCMLFEFLLGYPPFHAPTVEEVFKNILSGRIDWPDFPNEDIEREFLTPEAKDLISRLLIINPEERLGANTAQEIKDHPYFEGLDWDHVYDETASFVPVVDHPESTDYFDLRGAVLEDLNGDKSHLDPISNSLSLGYSVQSEELQRRVSSNHSSGSSTPIQRLSIASVLESLSQDSPSNTSSPTAKHLPLPIPPHLRERRTSKLNDIQTEFGSFSFRNLSALDKANKDTINRLKNEHFAEHAHLHQRGSTNSLSSTSSEASGKLRSGKSPNNVSPAGGTPTTKSFRRSISPSVARNQSPRRHDSFESSTPSRRNTLEYSPSASSIFPEDSGSPCVSKFRSPLSPPSNTSRSRMHSRTSSQRTNVSELSADDSERSYALSKVNTARSRRRSGRKSSSGVSEVGCNMDVLLCEPIPIHRYRLVKDLESLGCSVVGVGAGDELVRRATAGVKFDLIITALKLPKLGAVDIAKLLRHTNSANCNTPIVAVTAYYGEAESTQVFDDVLEKPVGIEQIRGLIAKYALQKSQEDEDTIISDTEPDTHALLGVGNVSPNVL